MVAEAVRSYGLRGVIQPRTSASRRGGVLPRCVFLFLLAPEEAPQGPRDPGELRIHHGQQMILRELLVQMAGRGELTLDGVAALFHRLTPLAKQVDGIGEI